MSQSFIRRKEDFICEYCGASVKGNGYTNHCPHCLWSKHVDIHPGDRAADCGGLMQPDQLELKRGRYLIRHRCVKCGQIRPNQTSPDDDIAAIL